MDTLETLIAKVQKIDDFAATHRDLLQTAAAGVREELKISSPVELRKNFKALSAEHAVLSIGVLGKVKAGKSSLLNALFFEGRSVLPHAATPMTASLTQLCYDEVPHAQVEFYSAADLEVLKQRSAEYNRLLQAYMQEALDDIEHHERTAAAKKRAARFRPSLSRRSSMSPQDQAKSRAQEKMREQEALCAAHEQYQSIMQSQQCLDIISRGKTYAEISASDTSKLMELLQNYVGPQGCYTPIAKAMTLYLNEPGLKGLEVVDTPGLNDPVVTRTERTRSYIKQCNVAMIVTNASDFLKQEDLVLMGGIAKRDGIHEQILIASQTDDLLKGSSGENNGYQLNLVLPAIRSELTEHAQRSFQDFISNNPECEEQFKPFAAGDSQIFFTSSICYALAQRLDDPESWSAQMNHTYHKILESYYGQDFNTNQPELTKSNLQRLGGMEGVRNFIAKMQQRKTAILQQQLNEKLSAEQQIANAYQAKLIEVLEDKANMLQHERLDDIKAAKENLIREKDAGEAEVQAAYIDTVDALHLDAVHRVRKLKDSFFKETAAAIRSERSEETHSKTYTTGIWFWKKTHTDYYTVTTVMTDPVRNAIDDLVFNLQTEISAALRELTMQWRKQVYRAVTGIIGESEELSASLDLKTIKTVVRRNTSALTIPELKIDDMQFTPKVSGSKLEDCRAEEFLEQASNFMSALKQTFFKRSSELIASLDEELKKIELPHEIFADLEQELQEKERLFAHTAENLQQLKNCIAELKEF